MPLHIFFSLTDFALQCVHNDTNNNDLLHYCFDIPATSDPNDDKITLNNEQEAEDGNIQPKSHATNHVTVDPAYRKLSAPNFVWNSIDGISFMELIDEAYREIVQWKPNLFPLPMRSSSNHFVKECTRLILAYVDGSSLEPVALKALMVMPTLSLQRPFLKSKTKDYHQCLQRRLDLWEAGDIKSLLQEGRALQRRLENAPRAKQINSS